MPIKRTNQPDYPYLAEPRQATSEIPQNTHLASLCYDMSLKTSRPLNHAFPLLSLMIMGIIAKERQIVGLDGQPVRFSGILLAPEASGKNAAISYVKNLTKRLNLENRFYSTFIYKDFLAHKSKNHREEPSLFFSSDHAFHISNARDALDFIEKNKKDFFVFSTDYRRAKNHFSTDLPQQVSSDIIAMLDKIAGRDQTHIVLRDEAKRKLEIAIHKNEEQSRSDVVDLKPLHDSFAPNLKNMVSLMGLARGFITTNDVGYAVDYCMAQKNNFRLVYSASKATDNR